MDGTIYDRLMASPDEWRDPTFLPLEGINLTRLEVRSGASSYELQRNPTNQNWQLSKPQPPARADSARVSLLIQQLQGAGVSQFVTDSSKADLESFGLRQPRL